jgi:uncharacterized cupredoxin-like copper-binding protein
MKEAPVMLSRLRIVVAVCVVIAASLVIAACAETAPAAVNTPAAGTAPAGTAEPAATLATATAGAPAPDAGAVTLPEHTFVGTEFEYDGPDSISGGWARLTLDNQGAQGHDLQLVKLAAGKTITDVMSALEAGGPPEWIELYGGTSAGPGEKASYVANLTPGNYVILSFGSAGPDAPPDAAQGMIKAVTVTEATQQIPESALPQAAATVDMADYAFVITGEIPAGETLVKFTNSGTEMHEAIVERIRPGKTFADVQTTLQGIMSGGAEPSEEEMPVEHITSMQLSPGVTAYAPMNLEAGSYAFICFIPSPKNEGKAHLELGMIKEVVVK